MGGYFKMVNEEKERITNKRGGKGWLNISLYSG